MNPTKLRTSTPCESGHSKRAALNGLGAPSNIEQIYCIQGYTTCTFRRNSAVYVLLGYSAFRQR